LGSGNDVRVKEHGDSFDIWLPLFGVSTKWNGRGSGTGMDVFAGDADSDRGDLRILSGTDLSVDPYG
jgi:hypothetical protein